MPSVIEQNGEFGGYAVTGWRTLEEPVWHVKVYPASYDAPENAYSVTDGTLEPEGTRREREAILHLIAK